MDFQRLSLLRVRVPHLPTGTIGMVLCSFLWSGGDLPLHPDGYAASRFANTYCMMGGWHRCTFIALATRWKDLRSLQSL